MKTVKDLTQGDLFYLANLATGGYLNTEWSSNRREIEVGGYGRRRRVEWIMNADGLNEQNSFEITSSNSEGWAWHCQVLVDENWKTVNTIAPHKIVDYLRKYDFDIENKER